MARCESFSPIALPIGPAITLSNTKRIIVTNTAQNATILKKPEKKWVKRVVQEHFGNDNSKEMYTSSKSKVDRVLVIKAF